MMRIIVYYTSQLKAALLTSDEEIEFDADVTIENLLEHLAHRHGDDFRQLIFDDRGGLRSSILLCHGDEQVAYGEGVLLTEGDSVTLLSAISGG